MKVQLEQQHLSALLSRVTKAVESRNTIPVLANVLLQAKGDTLTAVASDLDIEVTSTAQATVFVMRQIVKHEYIRISELSMRYVRGMPEYYRPKSWRAVAEDVKQGSGGEMDDWKQDSLYSALEYAESDDADNYAFDIGSGLAPEQARMFLRLCHMTQGHLSGSMDAIAGLVTKRLDPHAQEETREFARQIERKCREIWPWSWAALMEGVEVTA